MANEIKKFLDQEGVGILWEQVKSRVGAVDTKAEANAALIAAIKNSEVIENFLDVEEALNAIVADYATKEYADNAVAGEKARAEGIEAGLNTRIKAVEDDYLKAADKTELQGNIDTLSNVVEVLSDGIDPEKVDGVKDLIKYVEDHGTEVTGMKGDIAKNAEDIAGVADRVGTLEGEMDAVEGAVATKAEKEYVDGLVEALQGVDEGQETRLAAIEAKFGEGEGSVADMIADVKAVIDGDIDAVEAIANKNKEDIEAINHADTGILAQAKDYADGEVAKVQGEVDALGTYVGTFTASEGVDTVVKYIDAKTANIASDETVNAIDARLVQAEKDIDAIEADYLKAADKEALEGQISAVQGAVDTEKGRAEGVEAGLDARIKAIEDDYLKAADKTELQDAIDAAIIDAANKDAVVLAEAQKYADEKAAGVQGAVDALAGTHETDKAALEARIKAVEDDYLKAADKTELQNAIDANTAAINSFVAITPEELTALFAD